MWALLSSRVRRFLGRWLVLAVLLPVAGRLLARAGRAIERRRGAGPVSRGLSHSGRVARAAADRRSARSGGRRG